MFSFIMFKNIVETQEFFSYEIAKEFERQGHKILFFDNDNEYANEELINYIKNSEEIYAISFNYHSIWLMDSDGNNFWDIYNIPFINIVVDHPVYGASFLKRVPRRYVHISIDAGHDSFMRRFYPNIKNGPIIHLAGTSTNDDISFDMSKRDDVIFFAGNYIPDEKVHHFYRNMSKEYQDFYDSIVDYLEVNTSVQFDDAAMKFIHEQVDEEINDKQLLDIMVNMMYVDIAIRNRMRGKVIKSLLDEKIKVHVMGKCWDRLKCNQSTMIHTDFCDSINCLNEMKKAKVSLNVLPWFKKSPHDRIFNIMLNGGVCLSDSNEWINDNLVDNKQLVLYNMDEIEKLPYIAKQLLKDNDRLEYIARQGFDIANKCNSWKHRARQLLEYINTIKISPKL